jgi:hypothetical protein
MPNRKLSVDRHRALEVLAGSAEGCTEAILSAHGFKAALIAELIEAGLAAVTIERVMAGGATIQVRRIRITEVGGLALAARKGGPA